MAIEIEMPISYVPLRYVYTKITTYRNAIIDLKGNKAIHSCNSCNVGLRNVDEGCGAIHYGLCTAVIAVPSQNIGEHVDLPVLGSDSREHFLKSDRQSKPFPVTSPNDQLYFKDIAKSLELVESSQNEESVKDDLIQSSTENLPNNNRSEENGSSTFLRQKEAQLREKREREKILKENERLKEIEKEKEKELVKAQEKLQAFSADVEREKNKSKENVISNKIESVKSQDNEKLSKNDFINELEKENRLEKSIENKVKKKAKESLKHLPDTHPAIEVSNKKESKTKESVQSKDLSKLIPQFHFPLGKPKTSEESDSTIQKIKEVFSSIEGGKATTVNMPTLIKACGLPIFWKCPLFIAAGGDKSGHLTLNQFLSYWKKLETCNDLSSKFMKLVAKPGNSYLIHDDFLPLIQDVVDSHPGLIFLQDAPEFHSRYVNTVISRIFYTVNRSWSNRIILNELRKSNFLQILSILEEEDDINNVTDFFSYEHFYVIYCKFWELDKDHDLYISKEDLARHNDHSISTRMIEQIFSGCVTRNLVNGKMSYKDFVWFLISEEDKRHPTSVEYWFRSMDLDGDGVISMYEMEYFYEEMVQRMESMGIESLPFEDCLCQMIDMVNPVCKEKITLSDLKKCKMTPLFFDSFFNLEKYLEHEQKDPFANVRDPEEPEMSDWERFAAEEYDNLVAEEGANEAQHEEIAYEDDFEPEGEEDLNPIIISKENENVI